MRKALRHQPASPALQGTFTALPQPSWVTLAKLCHISVCQVLDCWTWMDGANWQLVRPYNLWSMIHPRAVLMLPSMWAETPSSYPDWVYDLSITLNNSLEVRQVEAGPLVHSGVENAWFSPIFFPSKIPWDKDNLKEEVFYRVCF